MVHWFIVDFIVTPLLPSFLLFFFLPFHLLQLFSYFSLLTILSSPSLPFLILPSCILFLPPPSFSYFCFFYQFLLHFFSLLSKTIVLIIFPSLLFVLLSPQIFSILFPLFYRILSRSDSFLLYTSPPLFFVILHCPFLSFFPFHSLIPPPLITSPIFLLLSYTNIKIFTKININSIIHLLTSKKSFKNIPWTQIF